MICQGIAHYIRWIPFDNSGSALRRGFAAALRCVTRVIVFFPGACPGKNIYDSLAAKYRRPEAEMMPSP